MKFFWGKTVHTSAGNNTLLSPFVTNGAFHVSIAQVPLSETFLISRGGRVGSEKKQGSKLKLTIC